MPKQSAGLLLFRRKNGNVEVMVVHPGGPFWARKDQGAWSVPKGEFEEGEEPFKAAQREFGEELGRAAPEGEPIELGSIKIKTGKTIYAWAIEADFDPSNIISNTFEMEWPPKSGKTQQFPEIDKAEWFALDTAASKMHQGQAAFLERLAEHLKIDLPKQQQMSLL
jgi:predicted NUDIX family NTP pyrophosphohydrolase